MGTTNLNPVIIQVNQALKTPDLQWVNPPYGEHGYMESGVGMGLKIALGTHAWFWKGRDLPEPIVEATYGDPPPGVNDFINIHGVTVFKWPPGREYAQVINSSKTKATICKAHGIGGNIDVTCNNPSPGTLVVKENNWTGWYAKLDGNPVPLQLSQWLSITLPAGEHQISFRYRPWDVPLGIALSLLGLLISVVLWVKKEPPSFSKETSNTEPQSQESNQEQTEVERPERNPQ
jgi:hypothetical protein